LNDMGQAPHFGHGTKTCSGFMRISRFSHRLIRQLRLCSPPAPLPSKLVKRYRVGVCHARPIDDLRASQGARVVARSRSTRAVTSRATATEPSTSPAASRGRSRKSSRRRVCVHFCAGRGSGWDDREVSRRLVSSPPRSRASGQPSRYVNTGVSGVISVTP
jgi:hypothetical protein